MRWDEMICLFAVHSHIAIRGRKGKAIGLSAGITNRIPSRRNQEPRSNREGEGSPLEIPTTSRSGCRLNVILLVWASRNAQASFVHPVVLACGNYSISSLLYGRDRRHQLVVPERELVRYEEAYEEESYRLEQAVECKVGQLDSDELGIECEVTWFAGIPSRRLATGRDRPRVCKGVRELVRVGRRAGVWVPCLIESR